MALEWPPDLGTATIEGRVLLMSGDGPDADRSPDVMPGQGTVSVEASVKTVRYVGSQGTALFVKQVTTGVLDAEGYLCTKAEDGAAGTRGLIVPATDSSLLSPTGFTYTVKITVGTYSSAFSIAAPAGTVVDLARAAPVPSSGGTAIVVDTSTADRAEAAAAAAEATVAALPSTIDTLVAQNPDLKGEPGTAGPANALTIGTVESGVTASATIAGDSPAQVLSLVLPKGDKGDKGDTGAPGGSGLGWRDVTSLIDPARLNTGTRVYLLRTTDMVWWKWKGGFASSGIAMSIPVDYQPEHQPWDRPVVSFYRHGSLSSSSTLGLGGALAWADSLDVIGAATDNSAGALLGYPCLRPLPATPLGDPVSS